MRHLAFFISILCGVGLFAQPSTNKGFLSVNNIIGAREAGLSGIARAINDNDLSIALNNPSMLSEDLVGEAVFTLNPWFNGVKSGNAAYAFQYKKLFFIPAISFFNFGEFEGTDNLGNSTNTFTVRDLQLSVGAGYIINERLRVGATYKYVSSKYDTENASFMGLDLVTSMVNDEKLFAMTLGLENVGVVLKQFDGNNQKLPSNLYLSVSKKLANAPFRFYVTLDQLNNWNNVPEGLENQSDNIFGEEEQEPSISFGKKLFFHTKLATELVITKNFHVRVGYNYQRREELKLLDKPGMSGFTYGFEFKVNRFRFAYARARYHQAFANNYFTISTNINKFK